MCDRYMHVYISVFVYLIILDEIFSIIIIIDFEKYFLSSLIFSFFVLSQFTLILISTTARNNADL